MKYVKRIRYDNRGSLHLIMPLIAIIGVAIVGTLVVVQSRAASTPYNGTCTSTIIKTNTVVTEARYKTCITEAQELMDSIQNQNYKSYRTAIESVPYVFLLSSSKEYYLTINGIYSTATGYAVKGLTGNAKSNELSNGTNGTWQTLCSDAASAGLAVGGKAATTTLILVKGKAGEYASATNATIFKAACGNLPTNSSGGTSGGGSSTTTTNKGTLPSGSTYNGTSTMAAWNTAIADRTTKTATWVAWGDSVTEGQGATAISDRWTNLVLNSLRSKYSTAGVTGGFGYVPSWYATYDESDWSTSPQTGGSVAYNTKADNTGVQQGDGVGLGMYTLNLSSGGSDTFKFTGSSFDVLYNYGSGTFSYKIDSNAAVDVSTSGGTGATGSKHIAFSSVGSHTVTITGVSGTVVFEGLMEYNGDESKGIRLYNGAQTGTTTVEFAAQAANLAAITTAVKADLVTIELGGNDFGRNSDTPAQAAANLTTMVKDIRSDATGHEPSIVLVTVYPQDGTNSLGYTWAQYKSAIEGVASANANVGLLDLTSFGTAGVDNGDGGLLASDGIHPSDSGQVKVAGLVGGYIEDY